MSSPSITKKGVSSSICDVVSPKVASRDNASACVLHIPPFYRAAKSNSDSRRRQCIRRPVGTAIVINHRSDASSLYTVKDSHCKYGRSVVSAHNAARHYFSGVE